MKPETTRSNMSVYDRCGWALVGYLFLLIAVAIVALSIWATWLFALLAPVPIIVGAMAYNDFRVACRQQ